MGVLMGSYRVFLKIQLFKLCVEGSLIGNFFILKVRSRKDAKS